MKKQAILFMSLLAISSLAGCGHSQVQPTYKTCYITFHQAYDDFVQDDVFTYTIGKTTYLEVKEFQDDITISRRRGYDVTWEEFDLSEITEDYTVNALYNLHKYVITYMYESRTLGTVEYTIESSDEEVKAKEPELPTTAGYVYQYENYSIEGKAENFSVRATRDIITYHATFVDKDGNPIAGYENIPFNVTTDSIEEPKVPKLAGYDGKWESYELSASDITIHPEYELHQYHAYFWTKEGEGKELVADIPFTIEDTMIQEPGVPFSEDYRDGVWKNYTLGQEDINVYPQYGDYHVFKILYKKSPDDRNPVASSSFTYESKQQVLIDGYRKGYHVTWKYENVEYEGGTSIELGMHDYTFLLKQEVAHTYTVTLNPGEGSIQGQTTFEVTYDQPYELETPIYDYHDFTGWYDQNGQKIELSGKWTTDEDVLADAHYINHQYHIYYKESAESEEYLVDPVAFDVESLDQTILEGAQYGYHSSWLLGEEVVEGGTLMTLTNQDYTFILKSSTPHKHIITLDPGEGSVEGGTSFEVTFDAPYTINPASLQYHDFIGWYDDEDEVPLTGNWSIDEDLTLDAQYSEGLSFERDDVYDFITIKVNVSSLEITDESSTRGSKSLKIVKSTDGDFGVYFSKQYLDDMFADPEVVAINFDAKASSATSNFRAKIAGTNVTYEQNNTNYGLTTEWKTFTFRRSYYNSYQAGDAMIYGGNNDAKTFKAGEYVLIDNVVPVTKELDSFGFENGYLNVTGREYRSSGHGNNNPASEVIFRISPASSVTINNLGFDYEDKTEGNRSLTYSKNNGYVAMYLSTAIRNAMGNNGYVEFDFETSVAINSNPNVKNALDGYNNALGGAGYYLPKGWSTIHLDASKSVTSDGRFFILQGSTSYIFHFDNIRIVHID